MKIFQNDINILYYEKFIYKIFKNLYKDKILVSIYGECSRKSSMLKN